MKTLSVVCARKGSKGLRDKCTRGIRGRMAAEYAIDYSLSLGKEVKTVVSTNIERVISYCKRKKIPYISRPSKLCGDASRIDDVLADAIEREGAGYRYCSLVYGNIPTRYPQLFYDAIVFLRKNRSYDAVISMQRIEKYHPEWMFEFTDRELPMKREAHYRRQALPKLMIHDGHTLVFEAQKFYKKFTKEIPYKAGFLYSIYGDRIKAMIVNETVVDIDTRKDLTLAKAVIDSRLNKESGF
ncbi:MAG: hypothetical protein ABID09_04510 [Candidatus Omnitrophota bacterium]